MHVAAVLAHGALGDAALFLPVAILEVLRERFRGFRSAFGGSLARYIRLLAEFLQVILMRGILASGEIEHLVHGALALALALQREGDVFPSRLFAGVPARLRGHARCYLLTCHHALQLQVLVQNGPDILGILHDLLHGFDRLRVHHAVGKRGQKRHEEHGDGAGRHQHAGGFLGHGAGFHGQAGHGDDDGKRRGAVQRHGDAVVHGQRLGVAAQRQRDHDGHGAHEQQRTDERD